MNYALRQQLKLSEKVLFQYLPPITASVPSSLPWGLFMVLKEPQHLPAQGAQQPGRSENPSVNSCWMAAELLTVNSKEKQT